MTPIEFEEQCKTLLLNAGWDARTTSGSGDQGADVIAEVNNRRLVVQCKYYSQPVGNSAVQEVVAARLFTQRTLLLLCRMLHSQSRHKKLAKKSNVTLLHQTRLGLWAKEQSGSRLLSPVAKVDDMVAVLNALGYVTTRGAGSRFQVTMPTGEIRHMGTEGAFFAFAEDVRRLAL